MHLWVAALAALAEQHPKYADQIIAAAESSFLEGDLWAYTAGLVAVFLGVVIVTTLYPRRDAERQMLAEFPGPGRGLSGGVMRSMFMAGSTLVKSQRTCQVWSPPPSDRRSRGARSPQERLDVAWVGRSYDVVRHPLAGLADINQ